MKLDSGQYLSLSKFIYSSLVKRFEILSGKEFASKVFIFSAYKAVKDNLPDEDLIKFLKDTIEITTSSSVTECEIDKNTGGIVRVKDSIEALAHGPSTEGVCYLTQGIVKAVGEKITGTDVHIDERKCIAKGDDFCEFAVIVR